MVIVSFPTSPSSELEGAHGCVAEARNRPKQTSSWSEKGASRDPRLSYPYPSLVLRWFCRSPIHFRLICCFRPFWSSVRDAENWTLCPYLLLDLSGLALLYLSWARWRALARGFPCPRALVVLRQVDYLKKSWFLVPLDAYRGTSMKSWAQGSCSLR